MTETTPASRKKASPGQLALIGVLSVVLIAVVAFRMSPQSATTTDSEAAKTLAAAEVTEDAPSAAVSDVAAASSPATEAALSERKPVAVNLAQLGTTNPFRGLVDASPNLESVSESGESATLPSSSNKAGVPDESHDEATLLALSEGVGNLRVSAILGSGQNRVALIGDKVLRPGDLLDEQLQVVAIHNDRVEIAAATESE
jgi:hypothetical protein